MVRQLEVCTRCTRRDLLRVYVSLLKCAHVVHADIYSEYTSARQLVEVRTRCTRRSNRSTSLYNMVFIYLSKYRYLR